MRGAAYLIAPDADLIGKIAARIDSPHDGEALSAARMTVARLDGIGLKIGDVVRLGVFSSSTVSHAGAPPPVDPMREHQRNAMEIQASGLDLDEWERGFIRSMWTKRETPTPKQSAKLKDLLRRARGVSQ